MCLKWGRLSPRRWQFSWAGGAGRRWRGPAGPGFGLRLLEMASRGRMEDVSARKWREAGPEPLFFPCGRAGRRLPGEATLNRCDRGRRRRFLRRAGPGRGSWGQTPRRRGVRDAPALGLFSRVEGGWAAWRWVRVCGGPWRAPSSHAARVFDPGTGSFT